MTKGYKTSEFWATAIVSLAGLVIASDAFAPNGIVMRIAGIATSLLAALGYTWGRTKLKTAEVLTAPPQIESPKTPDVPAAP